LDKRGSELGSTDRNGKNKCVGNRGSKFIGLGHRKGMGGAKLIYKGWLGGGVYVCRCERKFCNRLVNFINLRIENLGNRLRIN